MTVRGAMDLVLKPGARKMARDRDSGGYKTPNTSKKKGKSYSRHMTKGSRGKAGGSKGKSMGAGPARGGSRRVHV